MGEKWPKGNHVDYLEVTKISLRVQGCVHIRGYAIFKMISEVKMCSCVMKQ